MTAREDGLLDYILEQYDEIALLKVRVAQLEGEIKALWDVAYGDGNEHGRPEG